MGTCIHLVQGGVEVGGVTGFCLLYLPFSYCCSYTLCIAQSVLFVHLCIYFLYFSLTHIPINRVINFVSWNVKGLGRPSKLNKVITHLDGLQAKIVFLQETHLNISDHTKLHRRWVSQSFLVEQGESLSLFIKIYILIPQMCWLTVMADTS